MPAYATWTLPANHGIAAGRYTVGPGASEVRGNVVVACPAGGGACVIEVRADGSAAHSRTGGAPAIALSMPQQLPALPLQRIRDAAQAPIVDPAVAPDGNLHVGADAAPRGIHLTPIETHGGVAISAGRAQDGETGQRVLDFLEVHIANSTSSAGSGYTFQRGISGLSSFAAPPAVRLAAGTSDEYAAYAVRAVQLINATLPYDKRLVFSNDPAPRSAAIRDVPDGQIFIDFAPTRDDWNLASPTYPDYVSALAEPDDILAYDRATGVWQSKGARAGHVWLSVEHLLNQAFVLNPITNQWELELLDAPAVASNTVRPAHTPQSIFSKMVHELLHVLGFYGHNDAAHFPDSNMRHDVLLHIDHLPGIDGDGLLAIYDRFAPGTQPEDLAADLGPWSDTSFHLRGGLTFQSGSAAFGVASRNGLARPWAFGPKPWANLADNPLLSGSASWLGRLLGMTDAFKPVGGAADLTVGLATLAGQLAFTNLEHWPAASNSAPGTVGSGQIWGDGDLHYLVDVRGNTFLQTGGDEGTVTGSFFGPVHEAMGGTLERSDLSAAFGGTR
ncbi:MAG: hypothetical protein OXP66_06520 [Candidatus Tectomicrobia bacterium]|nr:hypothetical protein [Candidatus Tectomicrobia bacterium]